MAKSKMVLAATLLLLAPALGAPVSGAAASGAADPGIAVLENAPKADAASAELTLKMLKGTLSNNSKVDVFAGTDKLAGTIRTDLLEDGFAFTSSMSIKLKLTVPKKAKLSGAFVATTGAFKDLASVQKAAGLGAGGGPTTTTAAACPYTVAEVEKATGLKFTKGSAAPSPFAGGISILCSYHRAPGSLASLTVDHFKWDTKSDFDQQYASFSKTLVGKVKTIPGDKDKAGWNERLSDVPTARLDYRRGLTHTSVTLSSPDLKVPDLQARVLKLRRLG